MFILEPNCIIYVIRSSHTARIEKNIINIFNLENTGVDFNFAIISNPTYLHYETIKCIAQKKIPLFIEKPPLHSLENVSELVELIENNNVLNYVACNLRFHPCIVYLKDNILNSKRRINEINVYCGSYLPDWRVGVDFRRVYSASSKMGGGVHLDLFHELDYTIWLFGMPNKSKAIFKSISSLKIDAIDYANYSLEYESFTANIILNYYRRKPKRVIEILFDNETLEIDLKNNYIKDDNGSYVFVANNFNFNDTYTLQLSYFINRLKAFNNPFNSLKESIKVLKIVLSDER